MEQTQEPGKKEEEIKAASDAMKAQIQGNDPNEGRLVGVKFTADGEVLVVRQNGMDVEQHLPDVTFAGLPKKWREKHAKAMFQVQWGIDKVKKLKNRQLPLLRDEAMGLGVDKATLKDLETFGFIKQRIIKVIDRNNGGRNIGGRVVIYLTPYGKAYVQDVLMRAEERKRSVQAVQNEPVAGDQPPAGSP